MDARRASRRLGVELRETRLASGLSQAAVAKAAGMSLAQLGRIERGELRRPNLEQLARSGRALGLVLAARFYPDGSPIRDTAHLALLDRLERRLAAPLRLRREVSLPLAGDLRAWDGVVDGAQRSFFIEAETRLGDAQALERRIRLKQRDDARAVVIVLAVTRSDHNRRVTREHREAFRDLLPLDGPAILRAFGAGRCPPAGGIVLL